MPSVRTALLRSMLVLPAAVSALAVAPRPAAAQAAASPNIRIAVVNPVRVFNEMAETKAANAVMAEEENKIKAELERRKSQLAAMNKAVTDLKPNSTQWEDAKSAAMAAEVEAKVWAESAQAKAMFTNKRRMKQLFDKVQSAIVKVAQRDGIDLVIADSSERLPDDLDQIDVRALRNIFLAKSVLYVSPSKQGLDISAAVQLQLDADFRSAGNAASGGK
ncbi:MAG: hypothetical protein JWO31_1964 [Phycisphaerales bacterium]|nr:hypothetical protein [Phycisphaerales bacterium]